MKKRLISAAILIAIIIPLFVIGGYVFAFGVGMIGLLAYKEILDLVEKNKKVPNIIKLIGAVVLLLVIYMTFAWHSIGLGLSYQAIAILLLGCLVPTIFLNNKKNGYDSRDAFYLLGFLLLIGVAFNGFILLMNYSKWVFLYLILITTMTDTFALVLGKLLGKNKMAPTISPNKTWEGAIAGSLMGTVIASIYYVTVVSSNVVLYKLVAVTLVLSIFGQLGDLMFSKIKRENDIKDFSALIPGHGGILDRLDSIIIVTIAFLVLINYL